MMLLYGRINIVRKNFRRAWRRRDPRYLGPKQANTSVFAADEKKAKATISLCAASPFAPSA
jgi:hypothetical protein